MPAASTNTRERLLTAALRQIREHGVRRFSLRGTARAAGVDPAMVYRHFADKAELIEAVALMGFERLASWSTRAVASASPTAEARLLALGSTYVSFAAAHPTEFEIMFGMGRRTLPDGSVSAYDQLVALLTEAEGAGRLTVEVDRAAMLCWSSVHGLACLLREEALEGYIDESPEVIAEQTVGTLLGFLVR